MRGWRRWMAGAAVVLLVIAGLAWFLPARWAAAWLAPRLHGVRLEQVQGTLWDGRAGRVLTSGGQVLGQLQWRLSRRAMLGDLRLRIALAGPALDVDGELHRQSADRLAWHDVHLQLNPALLAPSLTTPFGQPRGTLAVQMPSAVLQGGWPLQLQAQVQWHDAGLRTHNGEVALGNLQFAADGENGMIRTLMHDDGHGPLALAGQLDASPLGWRLDATLRPRNGDPALRQWLASLGRRSADGTLHLQRSGGLAAALPGARAR